MTEKTSTRRRLLRTGGLIGTLAVAGCNQFFGGDDELKDTDGDGVIDSEDYAPRDPEVQRESQVKGGSTASETDTATATETDTATDTETDTATETETAEGGETDSGVNAWWDNGWNERYELRITERTDRQLQRYPLVTPELDIPDRARDSIRVVDHTTNSTLDFGVREAGSGVQLAFKTDLPRSGSRDDIAVYYDNPDVSNAAIEWGAARNNVYDDFSDGRLGENWERQNGRWDERGSSVFSNGDGAQLWYELNHPLQVSSIPVYWETRFASRETGTGQDQRKAALNAGDERWVRISFSRTFQNDDDGVGGSIGWDSPDREKVLQAGQFAVGDWITQEAVVYPDGRMTARAENEANGATGEHTYRDVRPNGFDAIRRLRLFSNGGTPGGEWDYVKLRYRVDPEPRVEVVE